MIFSPTEMSRLLHRSIWRETTLVFQLFRKALLPITVTIQNCLRQWPLTARKLSERSRKRVHVAARLQSLAFGHFV